MSSGQQEQQQQGQDSPASYKEQLDHKARLARDPNYGKEESEPTLLEKGTNSGLDIRPEIFG
jgi:hypothetical protein